MVKALGLEKNDVSLPPLLLPPPLLPPLLLPPSLLPPPLLLPPLLPPPLLPPPLLPPLPPPPRNPIIEERCPLSGISTRSHFMAHERVGEEEEKEEQVLNSKVKRLNRTCFQVHETRNKTKGNCLGNDTLFFIRTSRKKLSLGKR